MQNKTGCTAISAVTTSVTAMALFCALSPLASAAFDARNEAMGGTGVASAKYSAAATVNPALLTQHKESDHFALILPAIGAQISDPANISDRADSLKDSWNAYDAILSQSSADSAELKRAAASLLDRLNSFDQVHADARIGLTAVATVPNHLIPFAVVGKTTATVIASSDISSRDRGYLQNIIDTKQSPSATDLDNFTSRARARAALVTDFGVALAKEFTWHNLSYSVGITPKFQRVDTFNYNVSARDFNTDEINSSDFHNNKNGFNADIGAALQLNDALTLGLAVQNILPRSVETKPVNGLKETFKIRPQVTAGAAWHNDLLTAAVDVDLTPGNSFAGDSKPQSARVGAEFNAWNWVQLRAGYRQSFQGNDDSAFTAGIGLSPFNVVHLDITGIAGTHRTYGAVAQLTFTF